MGAYYALHTCTFTVRSYNNENSTLLEKGWFLTRIKGKNVHYFSDHDKEFIQFNSFLVLKRHDFQISIALSKVYMGIN